MLKGREKEMNKEVENLERMKMVVQLKILKELRILNKNLCRGIEERNKYISNEELADIDEMKWFAGLAFV